MASRIAFVALFLFVGPLHAEKPTPFSPDPLSVQRNGPAYRFPQAGWIVLHIEGTPYERGYQHGHLLAAEIADYVQNSARQQSAKSPADGWNLTRTMANALFQRRFDIEYLEEMKGIADGAANAGAKFEGRPIDLTDIVVLNCWAEIETLPGALEATPTGLEGKKLERAPRKMPDVPMGHCSAFAATGPATKDGKIVFGHITMFGLYSSNHFNVWLDVKPEKGRRVLMQSFPGGIQSAMDYYMNDAGILVTETTIRQTRFNVQGQALASRIRKALQYSESIDQLVEHLTKDNNGLYTNEWLIGDTKTNEIAMLQLGTGKHHLSRSSKNEWFGGTPGFYWGCNNTKDIQVRLETLPSVTGRPESVVWRPSERDKAWQQLYREYKGKIDGDFAKLAFTTPPLAAYHSLDAKYTTTDLAKNLHTVALFGPPLGRTWEPTHHERTEFPDIRALVSNPWTILHGDAPAATSANGTKPIDIADKIGKYPKSLSVAGQPLTKPAWNGTLLPRTSADTWLAASWADFERLVALEKQFRSDHGGNLPRAEQARLALIRNGHRTNCVGTLGKTGGDVILTKIKETPEVEDWHRQATGKGVLALWELRRQLPVEKFDKAMDDFGTANAGKAVSSEQFRDFVISAIRLGEPDEKKRASTSRIVREWYEAWILGGDWIEFEFADLKCEKPVRAHEPYTISGTIKRKGPKVDHVSVVLETVGDESNHVVKFDEKSSEGKFRIVTHQTPLRLVIDKYHEFPRAGSPYSVRTFWNDIPNTIIVYGTKDEGAANRDAAEQLQNLMRAGTLNYTLPIRSDSEVTDDEIKNKHVILIGRPDSNKLVQRFADEFPVRFGWRSFRVGVDSFANARSAVLTVGANPLSSKHTLVLIAGLSAEAMRATALRFIGESHSTADVVVMPHGAGTTPLLISGPKLSRDLEK